MRASPGADDWDFTPVIDLIQSLKYGNDGHESTVATIQRTKPEVALSPLKPDESLKPTSHLGNFDDIFSFLGRSDDVDEIREAAKGVRWRDEIDGAELADNDEKEPDLLASLTKSQRKKERRRLRRKLLEEESLNNEKSTLNSSENDSEVETKETTMPVRKAVIHDLLERPLPSDDEIRNSMRLLKRPKQTVTERWPVAKPRAESALAVTAAKKKKLIELLREKFAEDWQYLDDLRGLGQTTLNSRGTEDGVHIFVDASNIMIGLHDALKLARSMPLAARMRRQPISFHSLSLVLSRGRPTAKRVVVGSDNVPEMIEAKDLGYEISILERVHKAKELTPRQKRYSANGNGAQSAGSGSETTTGLQFAPEKWVEQAVDEILHLKMMESIVDASKPATMVLATGDAAEAEYSGGFMKMVERALAKGWKVELASFTQNTSGAYKRKDFRQKWGKRFKLVELDDFVEFLLGAT
ncbi:MAG: hypothetical protein OHK93_000349 [Ramalina farinacea]|uniref:NYN domain-containing protein n=1 Tax=Ramalina farinacea TaxID=258253 RepID=A0AA43QGF9_9LECA|nr:hypothetical protein [Ramalina farinacea]